MSSFQEATLNAMDKCLQELQHALEGLTPAEARWQPTLDTNSHCLARLAPGTS